MSKPPYNTLQISPLTKDEIIHPYALAKTFDWPCTAVTMQEAASFAFFLGAKPSLQDHHLYEKEGNVSAPAVIGTIALFPHGTSWSVGYVLVDPAHQRNGIATMLIEKAIRMCKESGTATSLLLSATEQGAPVYERVGFLKQRETLMFVGISTAKLDEELKHRNAPNDSDRGIQCELFDPKEDLERWSTGLELASTGSQRDVSTTLNAWRSFDLSICGVFARDDKTSEVVGYGVVRPYGTFTWHIGPLVATSQIVAQEILLKLISFVFTSCHTNADANIAVSAVEHNSEGIDWLEWLKGLGFDVFVKAVTMRCDVSVPSEERKATKEVPTGLLQWCYLDPAAV